MPGIVGRFIDGVRAALHPVHPEVNTCCVPGCDGTPLLILSSTGSTVVRACPPHARAWLSSEAMQRTGDHGGSLTPLREWAASEGRGRSGPGGGSLPITRRPIRA